MRRLASFALVTLLAACGSTQAASSGGSGHGSGSSGSSGGQLISCTQTRDCSVGVCQVAADGQKYCQVQCSIDADCSDPAAPMCNSRGQCVPRPATTSASSSTGTTTAGSTTGTTTTGTTTGSTSSSGTTGHPPTSSSSSSSGSTTTTTGTTTTGTTSTTTGTTGTTTTGTTSGTTGTSSSSSSTTTTTGTTTSGTTTSGTTTGSSSGGCVEGSCPSGQACDTSTHTCRSATGSGALGAACSTFADCQSGHCESYAGTKYCTQPCSTSAQCPSGFGCVDYGGGGACISSSALGFSLGTTSVNGSCSYGANPDPCHSATFSCTAQNYCTDICGQDSDCAAGTSRNLVCLANGGYQYCAPEFAVGTCSTDSDCGGMAGACQTDPNGGGLHCTMGNGCSSGTQCSRGACVAGTSQHYCSQPCCSTADCPGTQDAVTCLPTTAVDGSVYKLCVATPSGSYLTPGSSCDPHSATDCYSGICLAYDPSNAASTNGYCATTCCTDSDCPGYAGKAARCVLAPNGHNGSMGVCEIE